MSSPAAYMVTFEYTDTYGLLHEGRTLVLTKASAKEQKSLRRKPYYQKVKVKPLYTKENLK